MTRSERLAAIAAAAKFIPYFANQLLADDVEWLLSELQAAEAVIATARDYVANGEPALGPTLGEVIAEFDKRGTGP